MPYGLYISAQGAQAQSDRLEVIANNLANVDTVGFKRDLAVFQARYAEAIQQGSLEPGSGALEDVGGGVLVRQTKTDFSAGPVRCTNSPADAAIDGEGFFVVRKGQETFLTRAGNFRVTPSGELVTQQGHQVLGDGNTPVVINPSAGPWEITTSGALRQGDSTQSLALVKPTSLGDLAKAGENLFRPLAAPQPLPETARSVLPGYLEMSGVRPTMEMTALVEASRLVEANLNVMKAQDQMLGGLINRVLKA